MEKKCLNVISVLAITAVAVFFVALAVKMRHDSMAPVRSSNQKPLIVTTLFPLYDMARAIGGDKVEVQLLLPPGVEAHSFEPKPSDLDRIYSADLFVYTGGLMEPWAKDILAGVVGDKLTVVDTSRDVVLQQAVFHDADQGGTTDPHFWLDFGNAKQMAATIASALAAKDPTNRAYYDQNLETYRAGLDGLDAQFRRSLADCSQKEIVYAGHYAFGYLAKRYGLRYLAAQGVSPDAEPTAQDLAKLVEQLQAGSFKYVFYEELSSPKLAQTIAADTQAKLLLLNAGHNVTKDQFEQGMTFFAIMKTDLANLKIGLVCP